MKLKFPVFVVSMVVVFCLLNLTMGCADLANHPNTPPLLKNQETPDFNLTTLFHQAEDSKIILPHTTEQWLSSFISNKPQSIMPLTPDETNIVKKETNLASVENPHIAKIHSRSVTLLRAADVEETVDLYPESIHQMDFQMLSRDTHGHITPFNVPKSRIFTGKTERGETIISILREEERVSFLYDSDGTIFEFKPLKKMISTREDHEFVLVRSSNGSDYLQAATCPVGDAVQFQNDDEEATEISPETDNPGVLRQVNVAFHIDSHFLAQHFGSASRAIATVEGMFFIVRNIYRRDLGLDMRISAIFVDTTDPHPNSRNSLSILTLVRNLWNSDPLLLGIPRHMVQFISGSEFTEGNLGKAYLGGLCARGGTTSVITTGHPNYSFERSAEVMAHEMGHNIGANHCDGQTDCRFMRAQIPPNDPQLSIGMASFQTMDQILRSSSASCFQVGTGLATISLPFDDQILPGQPGVNQHFWQSAEGVQVSAFQNLGQAMILPSRGGGQTGLQTSEFLLSHPFAEYSGLHSGEYRDGVHSSVNFIVETARAFSASNVLEWRLTDPTTISSGPNPLPFEFQNLHDFEAINFETDIYAIANKGLKLKNLNASTQNSTGTDLAIRRVAAFRRNSVLHSLWQADGFGSSAANLGDLNADGHEDFAIGSPLYEGKGRVQVFSGASGAVIASYVSPNNSGKFGASISNAGDLSGDGINDLIIGDPIRGSVHVYRGGSQSTNAPYFSIVGQNGEFGAVVLGNFDINNDGRKDFAVGSPMANNPQGIPTGSVTVYSGVLGGGVIWRAFGEYAQDRFGASIAADTVNDVTANLYVGTGVNNAVGYVKRIAYTGVVMRIFYSASTNDGFGKSVAIIRDFSHHLGGPEKDYLVIGSPSAFAGSGRVYFFEVAPGSYHPPSMILSPGCRAGDFCGDSLVVLNNFDGHGLSDLAIGKRSGGSIVVSSSSNLTVEPADHAHVTAPFFGKALAAADIDGDGVNELIAGGTHPTTGEGHVKVQAFAGKPLNTAVSVGAGGEGGTNLYSMWKQYRPYLTATGFFTPHSTNRIKISGLHPSNQNGFSWVYLNFGWSVIRDPRVLKPLGLKTAVQPVATYTAHADGEGNVVLPLPIHTHIGAPFYIQAFIGSPGGYKFSNVIEIRAR